MKQIFASFILSIGLISSNVFAKSAADILLNQVGESTSFEESSDDKKAKSELNPFASLKIDDGFLMVFFAEWRAQGALNYETNAWSMKVLSHNFEEAAHIWSAVEKEMKPEYKVSAEVAQAYLLWRLKLPQTFFNYYLSISSRPEVINSKTYMALDQLISKDLPNWFMANAIFINPAQKSLLSGISTKSYFVDTAKIWSNLRSLDLAPAIVKTLPKGHPFKSLLAKTAVLSLAREGKLGEAGKIIKAELEPEVEASGDPKQLASYYLMLARLLYQAGALDASAEFYKKIPNSLPEFLTARTELAWIYLRKGDLTHLRGELVSLSSPVFDDKFIPEVYLVRSISNLKLCQYDKVSKDFGDFIKSNSKWTGLIEASSKGNVAAIDEKDYYLTLAEKMVEMRTAEIDKVNKLGVTSIKAALPAIGVQAHWSKYSADLSAQLEESKKLVDNEKSRFWKNRYAVLEEAIAKMRFVKVEAISQIRSAASLAQAAGQVQNSDQVGESTAGVEKSDKMTFKFDGVFWPDELFHLEAVAKSHCLSKVKN